MEERAQWVWRGECPSGASLTPLPVLLFAFKSAILVFVFCFFPLYLEILLMTSDYALGFYALFAPFLLPRESLDLEHVISLWSYSICFLTSWAWVCACQTFTVFKVIPVGLLILAFTGLPQLAL